MASNQGPMPHEFFSRLQSKLIDMTSKGLYPGVKYQDEHRVREESQTRLFGYLSGWAVGSYAAIRIARKLTGRPKRGIWWFLLCPLGGNYILQQEMAQFIPRLSELKHSLVCEEVCPYLTAYPDQYRRMLSKESFTACEKYCKEHRLRLPR